MAFEGLAEKLNQAFKKLRSKGKLSENDVKEAMREVRLALLEADVNYKVAKDFVKNVTEKAVGEEVLSSLTPAQQVIKIVRDELTELMGSTDSRINCIKAISKELEYSEENLQTLLDLSWEHEEQVGFLSVNSLSCLSAFLF